MASLSIPEIEPEWDILRAAMAYAAAGWYVLPLEPDTKRPAKFLRKNWQSKTSRDPHEIASWFAGTDYLLGLHVGRSGAVVIDLDDWDAPDFPLDAKMWLDTAPFQSTRDNDQHRGHYVFTVPEGRTLGNSRGGLGKGFGEVRGTNGIIVVQPSKHVEEHGRYEWQRAGAVPVLPKDISDLLPEGQAAGEAATDGDIKDFLAKHTAATKPTLLKPILEAFARELQEGGRHEALVRAAIWGMRDAAAGYFPAQQVWDGLWADFEPALAGESNRFPRSEFRGAMAWAVAQANATDPDVRRNEVEKRLAEAEPLPPVAVTSPVGTAGTDDEVDGPDDWAPPRPVNDYFDPKDGIDISLVADDVLAMGQLAWGRDSSFWTYRDGVWRREPHAVEARVVRLLAGRFRGNHATNAETVVRHRIGEITCEPVEAYINFKNCIVDWRTGEQHIHAPHYGSTVQLPIAWEPDAECPEFDAFLDSILSPDYKQLAWEMIGYLMMSGNPLQVAFLLLGSGSNGKGTLMRVIQALLGEQNTSSLTLDSLSERFAPMGLFGKIANLAGDIDATFQESTAAFKRLTGEDVFRGEVKFKAEPFYFVNWAVPVFSANKIFGSSDTSWGYLRRWKVIEFNRTITDEEIIPGYSNMLLAELPGIAVKAVRVLQEVMARSAGKGGFHTTIEIKAGATRFAEAIDQARQFVDECCMDAPEMFTPLSVIYQSYCLWADKNGVKRLKSTELSQRLDGMGYDFKKRKGNRIHLNIAVVQHGVQGGAPEEVDDAFSS